MSRNDQIDTYASSGKKSPLTRASFWRLASWALAVSALLTGAAGKSAAATASDTERSQRLNSLSQILQAVPDGKASGLLLLDVTLNGMDIGVFPFIEREGKILIPAETAQNLRLRNDGGGDLNPDMIPRAHYALNRPSGTINLQIPASYLTTLNLGQSLARPAIMLSPETAGVFVNYDISARKYFGPDPPRPSYGGYAIFHAFAPDFTANSGWSYDSARTDTPGNAPIRLDSYITWRPKALNLTVSLGDSISALGATARPYRFIGLTAGTDHSAEPGWSSLPIPSVAGTAQAASSIDLYVNGVRSVQMSTAGGPFNFALPPASYSTGARIVVTDITGRVVEIPFNMPRFNLDLVQQGLFLWSAGLGQPRFSWGQLSNDYLHGAYGYANLRYGISNHATLLAHGEAGPGLAEIEAEIKSQVSTQLGLTAAIAQSRTTGGKGTFLSASAILEASGNLFFTVSYGRALHDFNDAVSWSGRIFAQNHGIDPVFSLPPRSSLSSQVSWQPKDWLTFSSSYQRITYQGSPSVSVSSASANASLGSGATAYLSVMRDFGASRGTSVMLGISFLLGPKLNGSVSATRQDGSFGGQAMLTRPLGQDRDDYGWQLSADKGSSGTYLRGETEWRSGYGIPAVGFTHFSTQSQGYLHMIGAAGMVAGHAFLSDPVQSGIIIADVGQPNIPVLLNGYETNRTGRDGKTAIPVNVPGTPQRLEIGDADLPLTAIANQTREIVTIRDGSGSIAHFGMRSSQTGAIILLTIDGSPPDIGSSILDPAGNIPIDKKGRAWIPALENNAIITLELPDGRQCRVKTGFDGQGGPGRIIGPFDCRNPQ